MTPFQEIEHDLDWREAEMAVLRILITNGNIQRREKLVLFRAAWALLYAHYEGFCKFSLTVYYEKIEKNVIKCRNLPSKTQVFALTNKIKEMRMLPAGELISVVRSFESDVMESPVTFPTVETDSNLWPDTLKSLLDDADLMVSSIDDHYHALKTLVGRRNKIAHGERNMITDLSYYLEYENSVRIVMCDLALAIDEKIGV